MTRKAEKGEQTYKDAVAKIDDALAILVVISHDDQMAAVALRVAAKLESSKRLLSIHGGE